MFNNSKGEDRMRNKLSHNQMAEWIHTESISGFDQDTLIDEYLTASSIARTMQHNVDKYVPKF